MIHSKFRLQFLDIKIPIQISKILLKSYPRCHVKNSDFPNVLFALLFVYDIIIIYL